MSIISWQKTKQSVLLLGCVAFLLASFASAQSTTDTTSQTTTSGWSSSQTMTEAEPQAGQTQLAEGATPSNPAALPAAPAPSGAAHAQDQDQTYSGWHGSDLSHRLTFEAGGGFNAPIGNATPYITWGGNFTVGGGVRFSRRISALVEYQFMGNKLPGNFIAAANLSCSASSGSNCGITGGNAHINSITGSPVIDLTPNASNGLYLVGGWGWYHKSTNFSSPQVVFTGFGYGVANVTVASFTSNQWGGNGGLGIYHRMGGMYGKSKTQLFAEARYTYIHTPPITATNGLGTTELIPVTLGVRF
jgi:hypothetical protein